MASLATATAPLKAIHVHGLLGEFDHQVELDPGGITIVFGPNGVGKTKLFQLVAAVGAADQITIESIEFSTLHLLFTDGSQLQLARSDETDKGAGETRTRDYSTRWTLLSPSGAERATHTFRTADLRLERETLRRIAELPFLERVDAETWLDDRSGRVLSQADVLMEYSEYLPQISPQAKSQLPPDLARFVRALNVSMIDTQRLIGIPKGTDRRLARRRTTGHRVGDSAIELYAAAFAAEIETALASYARESANRDRTFVPRALEAAQKTVKEDDIRRAYERTNALSERAMAAGLLEEQSPVELPAKTTPTIRRILDLHFSDMEARLSTLLPMLAKIEAFQDLLANRLIRKKLNVDRQRGFFVSRTDDDGLHILRADALSSGEQHLIVMFYRLIFGMPDGALVLIDEPEISLNSAWQLRFIDDLERISSVTGQTYILATHSAQIVAGRDDLMRELSPDDAP
jgi:ABC-type lipoprotein export system ATPase subunit/histone H3/H4